MREALRGGTMRAQQSAKETRCEMGGGSDRRRSGDRRGPAVGTRTRPATRHAVGDTEEPHCFTWLWWLREEREGQTLLINVLCRLLGAVTRPLVMEFAHTIMMRRRMLKGERAAAATTTAPEDAVEVRAP
jgi:hypothetical protein